MPQNIELPEGVHALGIMEAMKGAFESMQENPDVAQKFNKWQNEFKEAADAFGHLMFSLNDDDPENEVKAFKKWREEHEEACKALRKVFTALQKKGQRVVDILAEHGI